MQAEQIRLGLVGYGEVGSTLGRGLRGSGLRSLVAYDKYAFDGPYSGLIQRRAQEAGVLLLRDPGQLAAEADIILGVTPGSSSLDSAAALEKSSRARCSHSKKAAWRSGCFFHLSAKFSDGSLGFAMRSVPSA